MSHKSAINWDYLSQARRLQEKLQHYFGLVEQIRALEEDPELQAALAGFGAGVPENPAPRPVPLVSSMRTASMEVPEKRRWRGDGERLLALARAGESFDAHLLLSRAREQAPELGALTAKQANDHLRRFAIAGRVRLVIPGKRGQTGSMPSYELVTDSTSAAETEKREA